MNEDVEPLFRSACAQRPDLTGDVQKYLSKVDSFVHISKDRKAADRLLPFSSKPALVELFQHILPELSRQRREWMITFWSTALCLMQDAGTESAAVLSSLADEWQAKHDFYSLRLLLQYLRYYPDRPACTSLAKALSEFFNSSATDSLSSIQWASNLQIPCPPRDQPWAVTISLTNDPTAKVYGNPDDCYLISLEIDCPPTGQRNDSWNITVKMPGQVDAYFDEYSPEKYLVRSSEVYEPIEFPGLVKFPEFVTQVEKFYGIQFRRNPLYFFWSSGLRRRVAEQKVLAWLNHGRV